jgi:hypothetical protein
LHNVHYQVKTSVNLSRLGGPGRRAGRRRRCYGWPAALCRPATGHLRAGHRFPAAGHPPASGRHYSRLASGLYPPLTRHLLPAGTSSRGRRARPGRSGPPLRHLGTGGDPGWRQARRAVMTHQAPEPSRSGRAAISGPVAVEPRAARRPDRADQSCRAAVWRGWRSMTAAWHGGLSWRGSDRRSRQLAASAGCRSRSRRVRWPSPDRGACRGRTVPGAHNGSSGRSAIGWLNRISVSRSVPEW